MPYIDGGSLRRGNGRWSDGADPGHCRGGPEYPERVGLIIPLWLGTVFATARTAYHYSTQKRVRELTGVADRLAALVAELVSEQPALPSPERLPP
jgi:hypothetical protein